MIPKTPTTELININQIRALLKLQRINHGIVYNESGFMQTGEKR